MVSLSTETLTHVAIPEPRSTAVERQERSLPNVGEIERVVSVFAGSLLLTNGVRWGLRKLSHRGAGLSGAWAAFAGYRLIQRGVTGQCALYKALNVSTRRPEEGVMGSKMFTHPLHQHIRVEKSVAINQPIEQVYSFWRNLENLPRFMEHLESVEVVDEKRSHWKAKGPRGQSVEWDATIVEEESNRKIAWKSSEESSVPNSGQVLFKERPEGCGTEVRVLLAYDPPAGVFGALYAKLFGEDPGMRVEEDLRRAKEILEAGADSEKEGQPQASGGGRT